MKRELKVKMLFRSSAAYENDSLSMHNTSFMRKIPQRIFVRCSLLLLMPKLRFLCSGATSSEKYARASTFFRRVHRMYVGMKSPRQILLKRKILMLSLFPFQFECNFFLTFYEFSLAKFRRFQSNLKNTSASNVTLAVLTLSKKKGHLPFSSNGA